MTSTKSTIEIMSPEACCKSCGLAETWMCSNCSDNKAERCIYNCHLRLEYHWSICASEIPQGTGWRRGGGPIGKFCIDKGAHPNIKRYEYSNYSSSEEDDLNETEDPEDLSINPRFTYFNQESVVTEVEKYANIYAPVKEYVSLIQRELEKRKTVPEDIKKRSFQAFTECVESFNGITGYLDSILSTVSHVQENITDEQETTLKNLAEEKLMKRATANKALAMTISQLNAIRSSIDTSTKKIKKLSQVHSEQAALVEQYDNVGEQIDVKNGLIAVAENRILEFKAAMADLEREVEMERAEMSRNNSMLRQQLGLVQAERQRLDITRKSLEQVKKQKLELENALRTAEFNLRKRQELQLQMSQLSLHDSQQLYNAPTHVEDNESQTMECSVCLSRDEDSMVLLFECFHYLCESCLITAYEQSIRNRMPFKYTVCPECHTEVHTFNGSRIDGTIERDKNGMPMVVFTRGQPNVSVAMPAATSTSSSQNRRWKAELCKAYANGKCPNKREECAFAHGLRDLQVKKM